MAIKKRGNPNWKKGQSGNPAGRPKDGESWSAIIAAVGNSYPEDILEFIGKDNDLGQMIAQLPKKVQLKYLTTIRIYAALLFEPTSGLWTGLMDRSEGKVADRVDLTSNGETISAPPEQIAQRVASLMELAKKRKEESGN